MQEPIAVIGRQLGNVIVPLVDNALATIDIIVYDWRFYPTQPANPVSLFNHSIARAAARGVAVRALVSSPVIVSALRALRCDVKLTHTQKLLHTKMMIVDGRRVLIGSHNYTQNAFSTNEEASALLFMSDDQNEFSRYFSRLWGV